MIEKIKLVSCGQPYYLQEICFHIFEEAERRITLDEFELGFEKAFSDIAMLVLEKKAARMSKTELKLLSLLEPKAPLLYSDVLEIAKSNGLKESSANTSLRRLREKGFLTQLNTGKEKGKYYLDDILLSRFLRRQ